MATEPSLTRSAVGAAVGGAIGKTLFAPFERGKLLLSTTRHTPSHPFPTILSVVRQAIKTEGVSSVFRGNGTNIARYLPTLVSVFVLKDSARLAMGNPNSLGTNTACGAFAGAASVTAVQPLMVARTKMLRALYEKDMPRNKGMVATLRRVAAEEGVRGLYRGAPIAALGGGVYRGVLFGLFDTYMEPVKAIGGWTGVFGLALASGVAGGYASYPFDTIRRRQLMREGSRHAVGGRAPMWFTLMSETVKGEGLASLFRGAGTNVRLSLQGGIVLLVYAMLSTPS